MDILEFFYSNPPQIENYHPRKINPLDDSFFLYGARGVGKSYFIINYLKNFNKDEYLYIDCQDPAFILDFIEIEELNSFIKNEKIKLLVLDHYFEGFLDEMPKVERLIIISNQNLETTLKKIKMLPLDFEEFLNFIKSTNITTAFTLFTKRGSLPTLAKSINTLNAAKSLFFEKFQEQEGKVLIVLSIFHTKTATAHQIYQRAKDYFKISKDWLYKTVKNFEKEGLIYQIESLERGFGKKIILYDFAFAKYLNKYLPFISIFDSIVAISLIKKNRKIKAISNPLGYLIDENKIALIMPFESEDNAWRKIQNSFAVFTKLKIKQVYIITVSNSYSFEIKDIKFTAMPFYEWAVIEF